MTGDASAVRHLSEEEQADLEFRYWSLGEPVRSIQDDLGLSPADLYRCLRPLASGEICPHCGQQMFWTSRQRQTKGVPTCSGCAHRTGFCSCGACSEARHVEWERIEASRVARRRADFESWLANYDGVDYVEWALSEITGRQRVFLNALRMHWNSGMSTAEIAASVGIQARWVDPFWRALVGVQLIWPGGDESGAVLHPCLEEVQILGPRRRGGTG